MLSGQVIYTWFMHNFCFPLKVPLTKKLLFLTVGMFVDIGCIGWVLDTCIN